MFRGDIEWVISGVRRVALVVVVFAVVMGSSGAAGLPEFRCQAHQAQGFAATPLNWTIGTKRMLVYPVRFADTPSDPVSDAELRRTLTEVSATLERFSYGLYSVEWEITPVLQLEHEGSWYRDRGFNSILFEARALAAKAGFDVEAFDLDAAHCHPIEGWYSGQANLNSRGAVVHHNRAPLYVHELGHNLGLFHANSWEHARPQITPRSSPPFPSNVHQHAEPFVFDPASLVGSGDIRSPGTSVEYGDPFDSMGGGEGDFSPALKKRLGWLRGPQLARASTNAVYRLFAHDEGGAETNRVYSVELEPVALGRGWNSNYRYWLSYRLNTPEHGEVPAGIELRWIDEAESYVSHLLDTRPGTARLVWDSPLTIGRTFTDHELNIRITPIQQGEDDGAHWVDVAVHFGAPEEGTLDLALSSPTNRIAQGEPIRLSALSEQASAIHWDFGDGTYGHGAEVTKSWKAAGVYAVRAEASNGRGRLAAKHLLIAVGEPRGHTARGRVLRDDGSPVVGALVHNSRVDGGFGFLPDYAVAETDSEGVFVIPNLANGSHTLAVQAHGFSMARLHIAPTEILDADVSDVDFVATPWPETFVSVAATSVREGESMQVSISRTGPTNDAVDLALVISGAAAPSVDYRADFPARIRLGAGVAGTNITFQALEDLDEDADEEVRITVLPPSEFTREFISRDVTNTVTYHYPGWEPRLSPNGEAWFQIEPRFTRTAKGSATFKIEDTTPPGIQRVSMFAEDGQLYEDPVTPARVRVSRIGNTAQPLEVKYSVRGSATNGEDYEALPGLVTIPAQASEVIFLVTPRADQTLEEIETVELEILPDGAYQIEGSASAQLFINEDAHNSGPNRLEFATQWDGSLVVNVRGKFGNTYVLERSLNLLQWEPISTNELVFSPTSVRIPEMTEPRLFYRSYLWQAPAVRPAN